MWFKSCKLDLHTKHFQQNLKIIFNDLVINKDFFWNDHMTMMKCVRYYGHRMNFFCKLLKIFDIFFGKVEDYFSSYNINEWMKKFEILFVTTDQTILLKYIRNAQIHQHKWTCKKKW
jgi:hypothetical protein